MCYSYYSIAGGHGIKFRRSIACAILITAFQVDMALSLDGHLHVPFLLQHSRSQIHYAQNWNAFDSEYM